MSDTPNDLQRFYEAVDSLSTDIAAHKQTINNAIHDANRQSEDAKKVARRGVAVGALGILIGAIGLLIGYNAKATADDIETNRIESIKAGCIQQNVQTDRTRAAFIRSITLVADSSKAQNQQEGDAAAVNRINDLLKAYELSVAQQLPYRDCTESGINNYIKSPPPDPNGGK